MMKSSEVVPDGGAVCGWDDDADASHSITIPIEINSIFIFCVMLVAAKLIPRFLSTVFYTEWIFNEVSVHHVSAYCIWCVSIIRARGHLVASHREPSILYAGRCLMPKDAKPSISFLSPLRLVMEYIQADSRLLIVAATGSSDRHITYCHVIRMTM